MVSPSIDARSENGDASSRERVDILDVRFVDFGGMVEVDGEDSGFVMVTVFTAVDLFRKVEPTENAGERGAFCELLGERRPSDGFGDGNLERSMSGTGGVSPAVVVRGEDPPLLGAGEFLT